MVRPSKDFGTVSTLSSEMTQSWSSPFVGPTGTSLDKPLMVVVIWGGPPILTSSSSGSGCQAGSRARFISAISAGRRRKVSRNLRISVSASDRCPAFSYSERALTMRPTILG